MFANTMAWSNGPGAIAMAQAAEKSGFESVWTVEHVIYPEGYESTYPYAESGKMPGSADSPIPDPIVWLAYVAAATTTIRLATGILLVPERNPLVLAKGLATLDNMSGGRAEIGIGVGWLKEEFEALGIPWERRGARTDEYIHAMRALWKADGATFEGEFASFNNVSCNPKPVDNDIPIVVGGHSAAAARRAGRLGEGFFPGKGSVAELAEMMDIARQTAADNDRDPSAIELTAGHPGIFGDDPVGAAEEMASIGCGRLVVPGFMMMKNTEDAMAAFAEKVINPTQGLEPAPVP